MNKFEYFGNLIFTKSDKVDMPSIFKRPIFSKDRVH